ncbi:hypothetical protein KL918_001905 [Ogataea parapolymorpha]|uniref:Zn(2)-C6 fungal-type domain-containing protein n=1 Tax=Ogataea parapolymorpha (strain ATCC 26012 / BCRC 20466 / JCM 22074 / NRRL Y-7560 / DL-1) TaxID=871575 RepID=W1QFK8_OGAPD|nr:hypothetical protein HPODL_04316 [Ogataea parapolymorpha DL-1]ESW98703.1 hypothetical protein HPODL_04316 [Ogataea parapolymorpha DL-1]KAG7868247.1 hypothetical protein KL918_001905 [Ogataea parapolymorpha]KAG7874133.1 hypothetical protein KL916_001473 [Ogataea parapolymorpha]
MSSGTDSKVKKSRNRVPISCEPCRKKKLKCDRTKPCSSCVKNKTQYSCKYANQNLDNMNKMQLTTEIINLKMKVNKLEKILQANNINASEYSDLSFVFNESISRMSEDQEDPVLDLSEKFDRMIFKENRMLRSGATSYVTFIKADKQLSLLFEALNKRHEQEYEEYMNAQKIKVQHDSKMFDNSNIARKHAYQDKDLCMDSILSGMTTTTLTASGLLKSQDIFALASSKLPPMFAIEALVDRFFTHAYYLVPFVDEETFREELTYVLLSDEKGNPSFKVAHHQNTSIVSLLLIILRYAYMTINVKEFDENPRSIEDENLATMLRMGIVIGPQYIELAKNVLLSMPPEESIFRKVTIRNIQVLMFLRWYQSYSPELSEDYYEASISLSLIIQMCRVLGINRDPDHFSEVFRDEKVKNLRRRIFYKLYYMDTLSAFDLGTPVVIHPDEYDAMLPKISAKEKATLDDFKRGMSISITGKQLKSIINENAINRDIDLEFEVAKLIRRAIQLCRNYDDGAKKSEFLAHIQRIELFLNSRLSSIYEMLDSGELAGSFKIDDPIERIFNISKIKKLEMRLVLLSLLNCLHYLLFLYASEDQEEEKLEHAMKASEPALILFKFTYDFVKYLTESSTIHGASKSHQNFKRFFNGLEIPFASKVQACFHRGILWTMSIFLQNFTSDHLKFEILLKKFGNSVDSVVVLNWLNIDLDRNTNDQFLIIMFHYLKEYYLNSIGLKTDFFCCWRVSMIIKIFFNFFKNTKQERFEKVLTHYELASENQNLRKDFSYAEARILSSDPEKLKSGLSLPNMPNPLEPEPTQLTTKGFEQIIYGNGDEYLDELLKEDLTYRPSARAYSFFNVSDFNALGAPESFQSTASSSVNRPSETDSFSHSNSTDHPSTKSSGSVGNVTFEDPSKADVMSFEAPDLVSPFDTYASQISAIDQEVPGEKSINLQDFISQFSKDSMFSN